MFVSRIFAAFLEFEGKDAVIKCNHQFQKGQQNLNCAEKNHMLHLTCKVP